MTSGITLRDGLSGWAVYYSQRGERASELVFAAEDKAYAELHRRVMGDPTTR